MSPGEGKTTLGFRRSRLIRLCGEVRTESVWKKAVSFMKLKEGLGSTVEHRDQSFGLWTPSADRILHNY